MKIKAIALFFILFACAGPTAARAYVQLPGVVHVYSSVSSGFYSIEDLVAIAKASGLKAVILTDHSLVALEYGSFPLRNMIKKRVEKDSVIRMGPEKYLAMIDKINQRQKDVIVLPGLQASPFYYWTGSLFKGNLTAHDYRKELLLIGLRSADDYRNLPLPHRGFSTRYVKDLLPQGIIFFLVFLLSIYLIYKKRGFRISGIVLGVSSVILMINHHPFQSSRFDPYHGDQKIAPYQELIEYVQKRGGLTFWAHPEANYSKAEKIGPFNLVTAPYVDSLSSARGYTGTSVLYPDAATITEPGKKWDQLLNEYCTKERRYPVWGIAGANFRGDAGGAPIDSLQTVFLVRKQTEREILEALAKGRLYARHKGAKAALFLENFKVTDKEAGSTALTGDEIGITSRPEVGGRLYASDGGKYLITVSLIKGGKLMRTFEGETPMDFLFEDQGFLAGKTYYRVDIQGAQVGKLISNPIFVEKITGGRPSQAVPAPTKKDRPVAAESGRLGGRTKVEGVEDRLEIPARAPSAPQGLPAPEQRQVSRQKPEDKETGPAKTMDRIPPPKKGPSVEASGRGGEINREIVKSPPTPHKLPAAAKPVRYPYSIQNASFPDFDMAVKATERHQKAGLPSYYVKVNLGKKGIWWRVYIGHFQTQAEADKARQKYGLLDSMVRKTAYANLIGVFPSEDKLAAIRSRLDEMQLSPYVIEERPNRLRLYVGAFLTLKGARDQKIELQKKGVQCQIVQR